MVLPKVRRQVKMFEAAIITAKAVSLPSGRAKYIILSLRAKSARVMPSRRSCFPRPFKTEQERESVNITGQRGARQTMSVAAVLLL